MSSSKFESLAKKVTEAQAGDQQARNQLFQEWQPRVFIHCLQLVRDFHDAQDLSQDILFQAMRKLSQLRDPACFAAWISSITKRMAINFHLRQARQHIFAPESKLLEKVTDTTPFDIVLLEEKRLAIRAGVRRLREMDREVLDAFYLKEQSLLETSDTLDAPLGTIKRRLHVARKRAALELTN